MFPMFCPHSFSSPSLQDSKRPRRVTRSAYNPPAPPIRRAKACWISPALPGQPRGNPPYRPPRRPPRSLILIYWCPCWPSFLPLDRLFLCSPVFVALFVPSSLHCWTQDRPRPPKSSPKPSPKSPRNCPKTDFIFETVFATYFL